MLKKYAVWFSGGKGTGVFNFKTNEWEEWYVCFEGTKEECDSYVVKFDHFHANWKVEESK